MPRCIGIDYGTTKSVVSWVNPATGRAETVRIGRDSDIVPTSVYKGDNGLLFGDDAEDEMLVAPLRYRRNFKLSLGEDTPLLRGTVEGRNLDAESLTSFYLGYLREECCRPGFIDGTPIEKAVITFPVTFALHPAKLEALERAAKNAGFNNVKLMCEPEAAGHAFLKEVGSNSNKPILVVDWGGGTLDISILSIGADNKIKCLRRFFKGSDTMGGERIDRLLLDYAKKRYAEEKCTKIDNALCALPKQLRTVERFKKQLDRQDSASLILADGLSGIKISRSDLATIIEPFMDEAIMLIRGVLDTAKNNGCLPDRLLLIGGTNRMPYMQEKLKKEFGMQTIVWQNSRVAVSLGAAYAADGGAHPAKVKSTSPVKKQRPKKQSAKEKPQSQPQKSKPKTKPNPPKDKGKKWKPGVYHPTIPHIFTAWTEGVWDCDPGYVFKKPGYPLEGVKWVAGQTIFNVPNIHSGVKEGTWFPDYGYEFNDPNNPLKGVVKIRSNRTANFICETKHNKHRVTLEDVKRVFQGIQVLHYRAPSFGEALFESIKPFGRAIGNMRRLYQSQTDQSRILVGNEIAYERERFKDIGWEYPSDAMYLYDDSQRYAGWAIVPGGIYMKEKSTTKKFRWDEISKIEFVEYRLKINDYVGPETRTTDNPSVVSAIKTLAEIGTGRLRNL